MLASLARVGKSRKLGVYSDYILPSWLFDSLVLGSAKETGALGVLSQVTLTDFEETSKGNAVAPEYEAVTKKPTVLIALPKRRS